MLGSDKVPTVPFHILTAFLWGQISLTLCSPEVTTRSFSKTHSLKWYHFSPVIYESNRFTSQFREGFRFDYLLWAHLIQTTTIKIELTTKFASSLAQICEKYPGNSTPHTRITECLYCVSPVQDYHGYYFQHLAHARVLG